MLAVAFFDRSPYEYMSTPQATEQYGQVLRVSVARASLNSRTSASASRGEKPSRARLDPASEAPVSVRNSRRVSSVIGIPLDMSARGVCATSIPQMKAAGAAIRPRRDFRGELLVCDDRAGI